MIKTGWLTVRLQRMDSNNPVIEQMRRFIGKTYAGSPSAYMRWLNPLIVSADPGKLVLAYYVREEMLNPARSLHGGVTAGIIDDAIGATIYSLNLPEDYTTVNNVIDYFAPAFPGDTVEARTYIIKHGQQIINAGCEVWLPLKKRLVAKGYSNMMRLNKTPAAE